MARKKLTPLVQMLALFNQLSESDKQTVAEYVRSQTATPRKSSSKKPKKDTPLLAIKTDANAEPHVA